MKNAVVTGGSDGIGKALVLQLIENGYQVITIGRDSKKLEELKQHNPKLINTFKGDLTLKKDIDSFIHIVKDSFKEVDLLVNNAGINIGIDLLDKAPINSLDQMLSLHIKAPLQLYQAFSPLMKLKPTSQIINIVSGVVKNYIKETYGLYTISKNGEYGLGKMMIKEATKHKIKVTNVILGGVETNLRKELRPAYLKPGETAETLMRIIDLPERVYVPEISIHPQVDLL